MICTLLLSIGWVLAQEDTTQRLLSCAGIEDARGRLACYDSLARTLVPNGIESAETWTVQNGPDQDDGPGSISLSTEATVGSTPTSSGDPQSLWIRCTRGEIRAFIVWQDFLGTGTIQTTYRIGLADPITDTWYVGADGTTAFFSYNRPANVDFVDNLSQADEGRLVAQVTLDNELTKTAIFELAGLSEIVDRVYAACPEQPTQ